MENGQLIEKQQRKLSPKTQLIFLHTEIVPSFTKGRQWQAAVISIDSIWNDYKLPKCSGYEGRNKASVQTLDVWTDTSQTV